MFRYLIILCLGLCHLGFFAPVLANPTINIICPSSTTGLSKDSAILKKELIEMGFTVNMIDSLKKNIPRVDINIFVQNANVKFFRNARKNIFLPNPDFCYLPPENLAKFNLILCKTKEAENIFKPFNPNAVFVGFTSVDKRLLPPTAKNYRSLLHMASSTLKGTEAVLDLWSRRNDFPLLTLIQPGGGKTASLANLKFHNQFVPEKTLIHLQNSCGIHLCPSKTEGFGHYILEAMSTGAVVVTTDAPPMNEFISDQRCLVPYSTTFPLRYATCYEIEAHALEHTLEQLFALSGSELNEIGEKNRRFYEAQDTLFKTRLREVFSDYGLWSITGE